MGAKGMWQICATLLVVLIIANLTLLFAGEVVGIAVGVLALLAAMYIAFRQGMGLGHEACHVSSTVESARKAGEQVYAQLDARYLSQAWSRDAGIRGVLASALIPYAVACAYIILALLREGRPALEVSVTVARVAAWLLSLPYWPLIRHWHESFVGLTPAIVTMLMVSPFVLPLCAFAGYMQGPRLWAHTEEAMKQGRRRAKARSRVVKKQQPRRQKPEI